MAQTTRLASFGHVLLAAATYVTYFRVLNLYT